jgi:hypothetical protein
MKKVIRISGFAFLLICIQSLVLCKEAEVPSVFTHEVKNITSSGAVSGGDVIKDGYSQVTTRGVCWSTQTKPTIKDNKTIDNDVDGSFISYLTGLSANTVYYVRAYATNTAGTGYGDNMSFKTLASGKH